MVTNLQQQPMGTMPAAADPTARPVSPSRISGAAAVGGWHDTHSRIAASAAVQWNNRAEAGVETPMLLHHCQMHASCGARGSRGPSRQSSNRLQHAFANGGWADAEQRRWATAAAAASGDRNILPRSTHQPTDYVDEVGLEGSVVTKSLLAHRVCAPYKSSRRFIAGSGAD